MWGQRESGARPRLWAARHQVPVWTVEDGFVRSVGLGACLAPSPSGLWSTAWRVAHDASQASDLEVLLNGLEPTADDIAQGLDWARRLVALGAGKYNHDFSAPPYLAHGQAILVVDQTVGDLGVQCAEASAASFQRMLMAALSEHPEARVAVLTHPDVLAGKRRGCCRRAVWMMPGCNGSVVVIPSEFSLKCSRSMWYRVAWVWGALWADKRLTCFGVPWYAGWELLMTAYQPQIGRLGN